MRAKLFLTSAVYLHLSVASSAQGCPPGYYCPGPPLPGPGTNMPTPRAPYYPPIRDPNYRPGPQPGYGAPRQDDRYLYEEFRRCQNPNYACR